MGTTTAKTESCLLEQLQSRAASADVPARPPATSADAITSGMGGCAITSRVGGCAIRRAVGGCTRLVPAGAECWVSRRFARTRAFDPQVVIVLNRFASTGLQL